jgi:hypothetical protein
MSSRPISARPRKRPCRDFRPRAVAEGSVCRLQRVDGRARSRPRGR